ncbi:MAG: 3'-5' exonuclease, partial [Pseudomonadota bacterium]
IIGVEDGILPHRNHLESESTDGIEEERRLFYVGMTRAQRKLTLTLAQQRRMFGEDTSTSPSRFLTELPTEDIQWLGENTEDSESRRREAGRFYLQQLKMSLQE